MLNPPMSSWLPNTSDGPQAICEETLAKLKLKAGGHRRKSSFLLMELVDRKVFKGFWLIGSIWVA